jgi:DNA-binding GntR family transcriptional regulator
MPGDAAWWSAPVEADYVQALYEVRAALDAIAAARAARRIGKAGRRGNSGCADGLAQAREILEQGRAAVAAREGRDGRCRPGFSRRRERPRR